MKQNSVYLVAVAVFTAAFIKVFSITATATATSIEVSSWDKIAANKAMTASKAARWVDFRKYKKAISNPVLKKVLRWHLILSPKTDVSFMEIDSFIKANENWPKLRLLQMRAEQEMPYNLSEKEVFRWFKNRRPITPSGTAQLAASHLKLGNKVAATQLIKKIWINGNFGAQQERQFYRQFRRYMSRKDHIARLDRLLWDGKYYPVRRMYRRIHSDYRLLAEARLALRRFRGGVDRAISRVPDYLKHDPGLVYERLRWRRRKGKDDSARKLLGKPPPDLVAPERWWKERAVLARRALNAGNLSEAYSLAKNHGLGREQRGELISAEWMAGWIALQFLGDDSDKELAFRHFTAAYKHSNYPISKARGSYWAGRAAEARGQTELARQWYQRAFAHRTTYYGQLAAARLPANIKFNLPQLPITGHETVSGFDSHELVILIRTLAKAGLGELMRPFIQHLNRENVSLAWRSKLATLAQESGRPDLAITVSKGLLREGFLLTKAAYPILDHKLREDIEAPFIHAIIRQESAFNLRAISHAGARGLMQLMPGTALRVAKQNHIRYVPRRLTEDEAYNLRIGQAYLADLLKRYDKSYILALAAYNAGPRRVRRWIKLSGDPRDPMIDPIDWVELIPIEETRNYLQRVLENLHVYRYLMGEHKIVFRPESDLRR